MPNFNIVQVPVTDRSGKIVGTDTISTPASPLTPPTINAGCVRVTCSCGQVHDNVPQAQWDSWPAALKESNGVCGCVAHFV